MAPEESPGRRAHGGQFGGKFRGRGRPGAAANLLYLYVSVLDIHVGLPFQTKTPTTILVAFPFLALLHSLSAPCSLLSRFPFFTIFPFIISSSRFLQKPKLQFPLVHFFLPILLFLFGTPTLITPFTPRFPLVPAKDSDFRRWVRVAANTTFPEVTRSATRN